MKAKNILMSLLLVTGAIAAKASGYPPELALVSQPVMVYNSNSITVYYDVENIGDYTYRGDVYIYLSPDYGYYYADKYVKVRPGRIKRIAISIPLHRIDRRTTFTIMPYYELDDELYSFTTFEYFDPISFYWNGPRTERWVVVSVGPHITYYHRPGTYRYYYDGYRPPMPPPGHGPGMPPPLDPKHHTYGYHYSLGGYPANHPEWNDKPEPKPNSSEAPSATVRPKANGGSMSSGSNSGSNSTPASPNNGGSSSGRVNGSSSTSRPSGTSSNASSSRSKASSSSSVSGSSSRTSNGSSARTGSPSNSTRSSGNSSTKSTSSSNSSRGGSGSSSSGRR